MHQSIDDFVERILAVALANSAPMGVAPARETEESKKKSELYQRLEADENCLEACEQWQETFAIYAYNEHQAAHLKIRRTINYMEHEIQRNTMAISEIEYKIEQNSSGIEDNESRIGQNSSGIEDMEYLIQHNSHEIRIIKIY